jgi:hypothetical protein
MAISNGKELLAADLIALMSDLRVVLSKARDINSRYFDTDLSGEVNALATGGTALSGTPFDKDTIIGGITVTEQLIKFADNLAVTQNSYRVTINKIDALRTE